MAKTVPPDWNDYCCRPSRTDFDFDINNPTHLNNADVLVLLKYNQSGILFTLLVIVLLLAPWCFFGVIDGFGKFDGAAGEASAVSHYGWWIYIELLNVLIGSMSIYFGLHYTKQGAIEKGVGRVREFLKFYKFMLIIAILANIVHIVLSLIESSNCTSTLCTQNNAVLVVFIIILFGLLFCECWQIYRVQVYDNNLFYTLANDKGSWAVKAPEMTTQAFLPSQQQLPVQISMRAQPQPAVGTMKSNTRAPLLQQVLIGTDKPNRAKESGFHSLKTK